MKRALISVSDKTGIIKLAAELHALNIEIISTGGTAKVLTQAGIPVINVSEITGFSECLDGRVKTLHPAIHAGILAIRSNIEHMNQLNKLGIQPIDLVIINLYPFKQTILKDHVELHEAIENIDIGGPTMLRAAAKNYQDVTVITDPGDYDKILNEIKNNDGEVSLQTKFLLAYKVFQHTSSYDALITRYLYEQNKIKDFPETLTITFEKVQDLRYGENPHQKAVFYKEIGKYPGCLTSAKQIHGKELSYNNINDTNGALDLLHEFDEPTIVAVKHANPCGVGSASSLHEAYLKAYEADPVSIFGGIIVANQTIDAKTAEEINKIFIEIIVAPSFSKEALVILTQKKNIRLLELESIHTHGYLNSWDMKKVNGGLLVQDKDNILFNDEQLECVTEKKPSEKDMEDLIFAWKVVKHTKSNGIVIAKNKQTLGIGPGQVNRIWATVQAIERSGSNAHSAVMASDAFFPFSDCVQEAAKAGIRAIIQPGGSVKDQDSIDACNKYGITMTFTHIRHFKH